MKKDRKKDFKTRIFYRGGCKLQMVNRGGLSRRRAADLTGLSHSVVNNYLRVKDTNKEDNTILYPNDSEK